MLWDDRVAAKICDCTDGSNSDQAGTLWLKHEDRQPTTASSLIEFQGTYALPRPSLASKTQQTSDSYDQTLPYSDRFRLAFSRIRCRLRGKSGDWPK